MMEAILLRGLIVLVALGAMCGYSYHKGVESERGTWERKEAAATKADLIGLKGAIDASNIIAGQTFQKLQAGNKQTIIDRGVIQHEIRTDVRYSADCLPDAGILRWNSLSAGRALVPSGPGGQQQQGVVRAGDGGGDTGRQSGNPAPLPRGGGK